MGVSKRGKVYCIDFYVNGKRVRETIGRNKKQAEQVLVQRKAEVLAGKYKLPQESKVTFAEASERYLEWSKEHKRSWQTDVYRMPFLVEAFGDLPMVKIGAWQVEQMKSRLRKRGATGPTVNRYLALLSSVFRRSREWGLINGENPVSQVQRFRENPGRQRYLSEEEIKRLLAACKPPLRLIVLVALQTGMRRGEIFALRREDVDLNNNIIHVADSKSGKRRDIPVGQGLTNELHLHLRKHEHDLVFARPDGAPWRSWLKESWSTACSEAKLEVVRFHDLRHSFASHAIMGGASMFAVQELLGHSTLTMTRRYAHLAPGALREATDIVNGVISRSLTQRVGHNLVTNANFGGCEKQ